MTKKKSEEIEETTETVEAEVSEEVSVETQAAEEISEESNDVSAVNDKAEPKKKGGKKKSSEKENEEISIIDAVAETVVSAVETVTEGVEKVISAVTGSKTDEAKKAVHKRAERIGIVQSDKMTKTVVVRVDRQVKHPVYRKYIKRKKNFMAHDEKGASVGDKVRIIETRPLSARKRWRVVEIIQKAEK